MRRTKVAGDCLDPWAGSIPAPGSRIVKSQWCWPGQEKPRAGNQETAADSLATDSWDKFQQVSQVSSVGLSSFLHVMRRVDGMDCMDFSCGVHVSGTPSQRETGDCSRWTPVGVSNSTDPEKGFCTEKRSLGVENEDT